MTRTRWIELGDTKAKNHWYWLHLMLVEFALGTDDMILWMYLRGLCTRKEVWQWWSHWCVAMMFMVIWWSQVKEKLEDFYC